MFMQQVLGMLFSSLNEGKNCKLSLGILMQVVMGVFLMGV